MANYRRKLDIIADILQVASSDAKKTHIMFKANLSYKVLTRYLSETLEASLISFEHERQCYVLTPKGVDFLATYKSYSRSSKHVKDTKMFLENLCQTKDL